MLKTAGCRCAVSWAAPGFYELVVAGWQSKDLRSSAECASAVLRSLLCFMAALMQKRNVKASVGTQAHSGGLHVLH